MKTKEKKVYKYATITLPESVANAWEEYLERELIRSSEHLKTLVLKDLREKGLVE